PRELQRTTFEGFTFSILAPLFLPAKTEVSRVLKPGDRLPVLGGLEVIESEGHTPGHISFFAPEHRILFSGDSIKFYPRLGPYQNDTTVDHRLARESFRRQMELKPQLICGGHGFARLP
ncbi:MAG TPA: MBL fold metallo-hydrolase, partial [Anaerolineaceae bacterium]|nr:MBL fold metallo-hydrolase [Anaerolineaceae bacterium]